MICARSSATSSGRTITRSSLPAWMAKLRSTPGSWSAICSSRSSRLIEAAGPPPRSAAGGGEGVGGHEHEGPDGSRFLVVVMRTDRVDDRGRPSQPGQDLAADDGVGAFDVLLDGVADVVEEADLTRLLDVVADLRGEQPRDQGGVLAVDQDIGAVPAPVAERPEKLDELRVDAGDAHLLGGRLAFLAQPVGDLGAALGHHLLDARGVDAAVDEEPFQGHLGDLPAHRLESGEDHRLGGLVDDDVDAGRRLEGSDVAPLTADDPSLQVVGGEMEDGDGGLARLLGGVALHGGDEDLATALLRLLAYPLLGGPDAFGELVVQLTLDLAEQLGPGLLLAHARDPLQLLGDAGALILDLDPGLLELLLAPAEPLLPLLDI